MCIGLKDCGIYWEAPAKGGIVDKYEQENEITKTESTTTNMT